jgi:hypothetical protein
MSSKPIQLTGVSVSPGRLLPAIPMIPANIANMMIIVSIVLAYTV